MREYGCIAMGFEMQLMVRTVKSDIESINIIDVNANYTEILSGTNDDSIKIHYTDTKGEFPEKSKYHREDEEDAIGFYSIKSIVKHIHNFIMNYYLDKCCKTVEITILKDATQYRKQKQVTATYQVQIGDPQKIKPIKVIMTLLCDCFKNSRGNEYYKLKFRLGDRFIIKEIDVDKLWDDTTIKYNMAK